MELINELLKLVESATGESVPAWYVVRIADDAIAAGPFDQRPRDSQLATFVWYNTKEYVIEFGMLDAEFAGGYDKFKDLPAK